MDGVWILSGAREFCLHQCLDQLWVSPSFLSNGYRGLFPQDQSGQGVKLATHFHKVVWSSMVELYLHSSIRLHGVVHNYAQELFHLSLPTQACPLNFLGSMMTHNGQSYWSGITLELNLLIVACNTAILILQQSSMQKLGTILFCIKNYRKWRVTWKTYVCQWTTADYHPHKTWVFITHLKVAIMLIWFVCIQNIRKCTKTWRVILPFYCLLVWFFKGELS
jgi:hypothetical protein